MKVTLVPAQTESEGLIAIETLTGVPPIVISIPLSVPTIIGSDETTLIL